jgi:hypothetical protein
MILARKVTGTTWPRPAYSLLVTGLCRIWVDRLLQHSPFPLALVTAMEIPKVREIKRARTRSGCYKNLFGNV